MIDHTSPRLAAALLLVGQLLYIVVTLFHAGGDANNHHAIFATYAANAIWTAVHRGQFIAMAIFLAGLLALFFALDVQGGTARWAGRFGAASAVVALALYGVVMAVDGVALKQAVNAWANAPEAEKAARFASAETIRWLEWGARSYQNFALGLTFLLFAAAVVRTAWIPRPIGYLMGLSSFTYLMQGCIDFLRAEIAHGRPDHLGSELFWSNRSTRNGLFNKNAIGRRYLAERQAGERERNQSGAVAYFHDASLGLEPWRALSSAQSRQPCRLSTAETTLGPAGLTPTPRKD